jgi:hypothetical protein
MIIYEAHIIFISPNRVRSRPPIHQKISNIMEIGKHWMTWDKEVDDFWLVDMHHKPNLDDLP